MSMPQHFYMYGPADLLTLVPHLIGYQPIDAVAALAVHDGRLGTGIVVDLPPEEFTDEHAASAAADLIVNEPTAVVLIGYETITNQSGRIAGMLASALSAVGLDLIERLVATPTTWRHFTCSCCPPEGRPLPAEDTHAVRAFRAATGSTPAASRTALAARIMPTSRTAEVEDECRQIQERGADETASALAWGRILDSDTPVADLPAHVLAHGAVSVENRSTIRDALVFALCPGFHGSVGADLVLPAHVTIPVPWGDQTPDGPQITRTINRLADVCANLPDSRAAETLSVLAMALWWDGQSTFAALAARRALNANPACILAQNMAQILLFGIPPQR